LLALLHIPRATQSRVPGGWGGVVHTGWGSRVWLILAGGGPAGRYLCGGEIVGSGHQAVQLHQIWS